MAWEKIIIKIAHSEGVYEMVSTVTGRLYKPVMGEYSAVKALEKLRTARPEIKISWEGE